MPCRLVSSDIHGVGFFFFKQKTAYDISTCLEFRRGLFRSYPQYWAWRLSGVMGAMPSTADREVCVPPARTPLRGASADKTIRSVERRVGRAGCGWSAATVAITTAWQRKGPQASTGLSRITM